MPQFSLKWDCNYVIELMDVNNGCKALCPGPVTWVISGSYCSLIFMASRFWRTKKGSGHELEERKAEVEEGQGERPQDPG